MSVAQLTAAIAGVVWAHELRRSDGDSSKLGAVLASAAALVATMCAEAAESAGAIRPRVTSAVKTALESRSPGELLTLTGEDGVRLRPARRHGGAEAGEEAAGCGTGHGRSG